MRQTSVFRFVRSSAGAGGSHNAPWDGTVHWFHGDLAPGNLLIREGRLASVVDFGTCGIGNPACDQAAAWSLLTRDARHMLRDRLVVDDATWARGRGWALWKPSPRARPPTT